MKRKEQKNRISILYALLLGAIVCLLLFLGRTERTEIYQIRENPGYRRVENYAYRDVMDSEAPVGVCREYRWNLEEIAENGVSLAFYLVHQEAEVSFDEELMYRLAHGTDQGIGRTTGSRWVLLPLYPEDSGKEICIRITPCYESVRDREMVFYVGSQIQILLDQLQVDLPQFLLGMFAAGVGLVFIGIAIYGIHRRKMDANLIHLGAFSIVLGCWRLCDIRITTLLFPDHAVLFSYIALAMLLAAPVPLLQFIKSQFSIKWYRLVDGVCLASILVGMVLLVLQFTGIADFRQTLTISHAMIGLSALVISGIVILEDTRTGGDEKKRISLLWVMLCAAGVASDLLSYYMNETSDGVIYTLAAFLFYVVAMGILSIRDLNQKAYVDLHTGLFNKSRCNEVLKNRTVLKKPAGLMMFDLNNLKLVNDTRGHEAGDSLIYHFAEILKRTVPDGAFVGRYGGDEFIAIVEPAGEEDIIRLLEKLSQTVEAYNNSADTVSISYAAGYGHTSEFAEPTLQQLLEKADSDMYRKKKRYHYEQRKNM